MGSGMEGFNIVLDLQTGKKGRNLMRINLSFLSTTGKRTSGCGEVCWVGGCICWICWWRVVSVLVGAVECVGAMECVSEVCLMNIQ